MKKAVLILSILAAVCMAVLNLTYDDSIKPDEVFPMANQHITWNTGK